MFSWSCVLQALLIFFYVPAFLSYIYIYIHGQICNLWTILLQIHILKKHPLSGFKAPRGISAGPSPPRFTTKVCFGRSCRGMDEVLCMAFISMISISLLGSSALVRWNEHVVFLQEPYIGSHGIGIRYKFYPDSNGLGGVFLMVNR